MSRILHLLLAATIGLSGCATVSAPGIVVAEPSLGARVAEALANGPSLEAAAARSRQPAFDRDALWPAALVIEHVASERSDVQAARQRAILAEQRLAAAEAGAGPRLAQSSAPTFRSNSLTNLVRTGSDIGQAALGSWPIAFETGADRLDAAEAERDAAAGAYQRVLIKALREVGDAIANRRILGRRLADARAGVAEGEATCEMAYRLYQDGTGPEAGWLAAARAVAARRSLVSALQARYQAADTSLLHALGAEIPPRS